MGWADQIRVIAGPGGARLYPGTHHLALLFGCRSLHSTACTPETAPPPQEALVQCFILPDEVISVHELSGRFRTMAGSDLQTHTKHLVAPLALTPTCPTTATPRCVTSFQVLSSQQGSWYPWLGILINVWQLSSTISCWRASSAFVCWVLIGYPTFWWTPLRLGMGGMVVGLLLPFLRFFLILSFFAFYSCPHVTSSIFWSRFGLTRWCLVTCTLPPPTPSK